MTEPADQERGQEFGFEPEAVRAALGQIVESASFVASRQLSAFLTYVVEKTLAGEADRIKAYSIATEALGRPETFDPASDPIVRVEAGRLRKALDAYYRTGGANAALRIAMPRGSYVPHFEPMAAEAEGQAASEAAPAEPVTPAREAALPATAVSVFAARTLWRLRIGGALAIVAFLMALGVFGLRHAAVLADAGQEAGTAAVAVASVAAMPHAAPAPATRPLAPRIFVAPFAIGDEPAVGISGRQFAVMLATAISRFDEVTVVTRMDGDADYLLSGRLSAGPSGISAAALLTDAASGRVIWSSQATVPRNPVRPSVTIAQLKDTIATTIAQPYGVVLSDRLARTDLADDGFPCVIRSFNYWRSFAPKTHGEVTACLEQLTKRYPSYAPPYAQLTFLYLTEAELGLDPDLRRATLDRAVKASAMAVQLAPTSARAMQALQYTYYADGQMQRAIEAGNRAMVLNPLDPDIRASQGQMLILAGRYQLGMRLIEESASSNAAYPSWYDLYLALAAFQGGKTETLRKLMGRVDLPDHPLAAFLRVLAAADPEARRAAIAGMRDRFPGMATDPAGVLARLVPNPALVDRLLAAGREAGLES
ncbi:MULTISPECIES: hypothetical protein [Kaistia]|uniref:Adenylate cyclase n=1 Tax=Kaistia nematophila TaxID=2994654 RepID=A0A9X3E2X8_9HYPH|nr:hypothetical protein [Kaistia nematophila]MCX5570776.1 hypothetical protein [Kaistia nematophila]